ncbi:class I poly(R)-hydroxyalkanoic acid synthase [Terrarubrum flagellatum]|uniref:PHA/PHB synthase family protein n=1 Tax=Terrirubrum flagellatum TaxID=2895980 RepID=UPI0031454A31
MGEKKTQDTEAANDPFRIKTPDFDALASNAAKMVEEGARLQAAYLKPVERGEIPATAADEVQEVVRTLGQVAQSWLSSPEKAIEAQTRFTTGFIDLWARTLRRMGGEQTEPLLKPASGDKRFNDPEWSESPFFDFLKQAYLHAAQWAGEMVREAENVDPHVRHKADFYVKQIASALSPSNYIFTNPELMRETMKEGGANLVRGLQMMAEDVEAGGGQLKIRQSDGAKFEVGVNIAMTPGKVVFRNEIMELLQYSPATESVLKRPLLIVPPWINKFYILDLNPEKSFIKWCVEQGLTVFCISWVNPDERHRDKDFTAYMKEGIFAALKAIKKATGEKKVSAIGYCVGGTLLASTLAYMAAEDDKRIASATFFTTQVDFTYAGDLKVFVDEEQIRKLEERMAMNGYLDGAKMSNSFNMLRPDELIWSYIVGVYLKGKPPLPFDLLYWNSDSTRMPEANHSFYLRNCYLNNNLTRGKMVLDGQKLDLSKVIIPVYNLATREDHIAPAKSAFLGSSFFGGPVTYVMAGSGHIAGVVNPPAKKKYQYWTGAPPKGVFEDWVAQATEHPGSWWPHWLAWLRDQAPETVDADARVPGAGKLKALGDAPGDYVKTKA